VSLYSYRTAGDTETKTMSGKKSGARIVSRLRHDTLFLTLPAARREELRAMIGWELASHYPGNPDDTAVSWRSERCGTEHRVTVWLMPKERLAMFGGGSDRMPALPGLALALQALGRVKKTARRKILLALAYPDCIETVKLERGVPVFSDVIATDRTESALAGCLKRAASGPDASWLPDEVRVYAPEALLPGLREGFRSGGNFGLSVNPGVFESRETADGSGQEPAAGLPEPVFVPFESVAAGSVGEDAFFIPPAGRRFTVPFPVRIAALIAMLIAFGLMNAALTIREKERELSALTAEFARLEREYREEAETQAGREAVLKRLSVLEERRPQDLYRFLSRLTVALGPSVRVRTLTFRDGRFELEAVGESPFALVGRFDREESGFSEIRITRVTPVQEGSGSVFSLSGVYRGD
jgi:hypothetical protein